MKKQSYGVVFRHIRKQKNIGLIEASKGIVSKSSLARWENGKDNLSWGQVLELLFKNHVQPIEFIKNNISKELLMFIRPIKLAYDKEQKYLLKSYAENYINIYQNNPQNKDKLFKAAIACNYYQDLTNYCLLPKIGRIKLKIYFQRINSGNNY